MTKIQIGVPLSAKEALLQFLQEEEMVHVIETDHKPVAEPASPNEAQSTSYRLARVQFALEFIKRVRKELSVKQKRSLKDFFSPRPAAQLAELEAVFERLQLDQLVADIKQTSDKLVELEAHIESLKDTTARLTPWKKLELYGRNLHRQAPIIHRLLILHTRGEERLVEALQHIPSATWQEVHREPNKHVIHIYGELVAHREDAEALAVFIQELDAEVVEVKLAQGESLTDRLQSLRSETEAFEGQYRQTLKTARSFLTEEKSLQFAYDALLHRLERENTHQHMATSLFTVALTGWVPTPWLKTFQQRLNAAFPATAMEAVVIEADDRPPVALINKSFIRPFEAVTNIYGKPGYHEIDPSGPLALFFLVSFGLALTDAGYGLIMMAGMWAAEKFFRLKREMRKMVRLLFYAGAFTTVIGALAGGWFGITLETLPESPLKHVLLSIKLIDPVAEPLKLLAIVFAIGIVQLLFAWMVRAYSHWQSGERQSILLDDIPWITMVVLVLLWAAARMEVALPELGTVWGWLAVGNAIFLALTQGRSYKNPFLKLGSGILSLYGLVGFLSDTLSYSRLLALGLATGIIGLVVNLIASMVLEVPILGLVLAVIVLLVGHTFNLGINTLGAFIHSGRLQFVEFFPKFMEGGGVPYKPLGRVSKYVDNPKEFV